MFISAEPHVHIPLPACSRRSGRAIMLCEPTNRSRIEDFYTQTSTARRSIPCGSHGVLLVLERVRTIRNSRTTVDQSAPVERISQLGGSATRLLTYRSHSHCNQPPNQSSAMLYAPFRVTRAPCLGLSSVEARSFRFSQSSAQCSRIRERFHMGSRNIIFLPSP